VAKHGSHSASPPSFCSWPQNAAGLPDVHRRHLDRFNFYIAWTSWQVVSGGLEFPELSPTGDRPQLRRDDHPVRVRAMSWRIFESYRRPLQGGTLLELVMKKKTKGGKNSMNSPSCKWS
jgi:hypothetical protein